MDLPTGIVTLVFTDIEGSTRMLEAHPDVYPDIVRRHREIVDQATAEHEGVVVGHEGDSCFLAFGDPLAAQRAAITAQRRLASEAWPQAATVRVRMGMHTGAVEVAGNDYYGMSVHTAARVADAAHGGQILVSDATRSAGAPAGYTTRDLGPHRLRDLAHRIRLHQVVGPGLEGDFPSLRALPVAGRLRPAATTFVGRESETAAVLSLLDDTRVVTILGPGGIGKTRFAVQVGTEAADRFSDGVWFADLTVTDDADTVTDVIAEAVGVSTRVAGDVMSAVSDALGHAAGLIIIDNFEHVIGAAPVITTLVERTEHLRILVTSRERLRLRSETIFNLDALGLEDDGAAVQLFMDRALAVRPDWVPTASDTDAIAQICRRLDGLPLAIELAAARVRLLRPAEISRRLAGGAIGLGGGARDVHTRQQTMRGTIEWSYQLLDPDERDMLIRLAIFAGPMRVEAVERVVDHPDVVGTLGSLVDKSLLQHRIDRTGATRVRMLSLVREFAEELLSQEADRSTLDARHAAYFTEFVDQARRAMLTTEPNEAIARVDAELPDIIRAFEWSVRLEPWRATALFAAMAFYFHSTGSIQLARRWDEQTRDIPVDEGLAAQRAIAAGYVSFGFRRLAEARAHWLQAIAGLQKSGDGLGEAWATISLGATYIGDQANHAAALEFTRAGIARAEEIGAPALIGLGFNVVGELDRVHGDDAGADAAYAESGRVARSIGDHYREATVLGNSVYTATRRGDYDLALRHGRAALDIHRRFGHHNQIPWVSTAVAGTLTRIGRLEDAAMLLGAAEAAAQRMQLEEMPGDVAENTRIREHLRAQAGDRFEEWYTRGRTTALDDAVEVFRPEPDD